MKIKALLAAIALMAATAVTVGAEVNVGDSALSTSKADQDNMIAVSVNDTIALDVTGVTGDLTLLSAKVTEDELDASNIQYVKQYKPASGSVNVSFDVREILVAGDNVENGLYCLKLNDGSNVTKTLYYKVGAPMYVAADESLQVEKTVYTQVSFEEDGLGTSIAYKANFVGNGAEVTECGFSVSYDGGEVQTLKVPTGLSVNGDITFGITVYGIDDASEENINKINATPFVNFSDAE